MTCGIGVLSLPLGWYLSPCGLVDLKWIVTGESALLEANTLSVVQGGLCCPVQHPQR